MDHIKTGFSWNKQEDKMIYAIGDLHLSSQSNKPMSIFGENWKNHHLKISDSWIKTVQKEDAVLIPGDVSWAMSFDDALPDLEWIDQLPGHKFFVKGNHDYWWKSIEKLNRLSETMHFIQNQSFTFNGYAICGTRGWTCPGSQGFTHQDQKIYEREAGRLRLSLEAAKNAGCEDIIGLIHFPPVNEKKEPSLFTRLFETYQVSKVVYGHIHGEDSYMFQSLGMIGGVSYQLVSCDYLNFDLCALTPDR
jgi:uncharacterized protein